jgi:hypothetical protein
MTTSQLNYHHIPVERTTEIFDDLVQHRVSEATVLIADIEQVAVNSLN